MAYPVATKVLMVLPDGTEQRTVHYFFQDAGDEIPLHSHAFYHSSVCATGECEVFDGTGKTAKLKAGSFVEFQKGREHGLRALTAGTTLLNINEPGY